MIYSNLPIGFSALGCCWKLLLLVVVVAVEAFHPPPPVVSMCFIRIPVGERGGFDEFSEFNRCEITA